MRQLRCCVFKESETVVSSFLEGSAEPFEDMEEAIEKFEVKNGRFTDIYVGYEVDQNDTRTDKEVLADIEKAGTKVIRLDKPP